MNFCLKKMLTIVKCCIVIFYCMHCNIKYKILCISFFYFIYIFFNKAKTSFDTKNNLAIKNLFDRKLTNLIGV